ncbi:rhodanese-like domain-containing protein [Hoeflea sp. 108]|uniref:rhodanese-like domain-containing protein n=1 Tax=Hoeflea sp. 108 TaxID=1116369 RepID=UPI00039FE48A|nr:rhodanese-like domain-containing protein [Hoeflea sp. 108]
MTIRNTMAWVDRLRSKVPTLTAIELVERIAGGDALTLIDIRELQELIDSGAIPSSHHVPRGMLEFWADPAMEYHRSFFTEDAEYVVYCAGGGRSVLAALALQEMGYRKVWHLDQGFGGWRAAGQEIDDVAASSRWQRKP